MFIHALVMFSYAITNSKEEEMEMAGSCAPDLSHCFKECKNYIYCLKFGIKSTEFES